MKNDNLLDQIAQKGSDKESIANEIADDPAQIEECIGGFNSRKASIRYGCGKVLRISCASAITSYHNLSTCYETMFNTYNH